MLIREGYKITEKSVNRGCPQASVLGLTLWNLVFNPNLERLESMCIESIDYAYDQVVIVGADSRRELSAKGQLALNEISDWCTVNKLELAPSKCAMMLVKGNLHKKCSPEIRVNGQRIKRTRTFKYVGTNFGTGISVSTHVDAVANRTRGLFDRLGHLARNGWGINYKAFNAIYRGLYVPISTYAAAGWYDRASAAGRLKLEMFQRHALIRVTGAYRTTSAQALTVLTGNLAINLECERRSYLFNIRKGIGFELENLRFGETSKIQNTEHIRH